MFRLFRGFQQFLRREGPKGLEFDQSNFDSFLLKQADAMIDGLRDERRMTSNVQEARASDDDESAADEEGIARAA